MKQIILSLLISIFFTSCSEYTCKYPISESTSGQDYTNLLGDWIFVDHLQDTMNSHDSRPDPNTLKVIEFNATEFLIQSFPNIDTTIKFRRALREINLSRAWLNKIGEDTLVTVEMLNSGSVEKQYFTYHVKFQKDTLIAKTLSERSFKQLKLKIKSSKEHKEFINQAIKKPEYWNQVYKYVRKK